MAKLLRLRRGTTTQHGSFTGAEGEVTVDTDKDTLVVHDNATAGGRPLLREDLSNLPAGQIDAADLAASAVTTAKINDAAVTTAKIADDAVTADKLANTAVTAGTYGSSSAIPSITVDAQGRVTAATTNAIDSTSITNGTSNVSVQLDDDVTVTRSGTTRLTVNSGGINVTGTVTCDGVTSDGDIAINSGFGTVFIRDNNSSGGAAQAQIAYRGSDNGELGQIGYTDSANSNLYINNNQSSDIRFRTANTDRLILSGDGSVLYPNVNNAMDLGGSSNQWRNAYFDGTVNCDGLTSDGTATIAASSGQVIVRDSDNSASAAQSTIRFQDSNATQLGVTGYIGTADMNLSLMNSQNADVVFGTNGSNRCVVDSLGRLRPVSNDTYDLGTSSTRWRGLHTNGVYFNGDTSDSNKLDDYEEGTWTVSTSGFSGTFITQNAYYVKVGQLVTCWWDLFSSNHTLAWSGGHGSYIYGFPFGSSGDLVNSASVTRIDSAINSFDNQVFFSGSTTAGSISVKNEDGASSHRHYSGQVTYRTTA